jgi:hypothetical protein
MLYVDNADRTPDLDARLEDTDISPEEELPDGVLVLGENIDEYRLHKAANEVWIEIDRITVHLFQDGADLRCQMFKNGEEYERNAEPVAECHTSNTAEDERTRFIPMIVPHSNASEYPREPRY